MCSIARSSSPAYSRNRPLTGTVTLPRGELKRAHTGFVSRRGNRSRPMRHRFGSEGPQGRSGDEMALQVEGVVDGGVQAEKSLRRAGRLEPLHLALSSSHSLMRVLGAVVHPPPLLVPTTQAKNPESS